MVSFWLKYALGKISHPVLSHFIKLLPTSCIFEDILEGACFETFVTSQMILRGSSQTPCHVDMDLHWLVCCSPFIIIADHFGINSSHL